MEAAAPDVFVTLEELRESPDFPDNLNQMIANPDFAILPALFVWQELEKELDFAKAKEMEFRKALFKRAFPTPKSGVNALDLNSGYKLKGTYKQNVKIDEAVIPAVRDGLARLNLSVDPYLKVSYSLDTTAYKAIVTAEAQLEQKPVGSVLRQMIITTDASPTLEIVLPKRK